MEVHLPQDQETQLHQLAVTTGRDTDELVQEAVARLLAHDEWFKQQVRAGLDQIARGEFVTLKELLHDMDRRRRKGVAKAARKVSS